MGFLRPEYFTTAQEHDFHYRRGCSVCPLKGEFGADMAPTGSEQPDIYILGEAPGEQEARKQRQFVGSTGTLLRSFLFKNREWLVPRVRWNNCVRTRPPKNREPTSIELACCRRSIEDDIEAAKPIAIFGFGNVPLQWALKRTGITIWSGRYVPVKIKSHTCWFFPLLHPSYIIRMLDRQKEVPPYLRGHYQSDLEFTFARQLKQAVDLAYTLPKPIVHTVDDALRSVRFEAGFDDDAIDRIKSFVRSIYNEPVVGIDLETNALRPYNSSSKILTVALSGESGTLAWPVYHSQARWSAKQQGELDQLLNDFIRHAPCLKAVHNAQFEQEWFSVMYGVDCLRGKGSWGCSMGQALLLDSRMLKQAGGGPMSLAFLCLQHFGLDIKLLSNMDRTNLDNAPLDDVLRYNAIDARYHRLLHDRQNELLTGAALDGVYMEHMRRTTTATLSQVKGIPIVPDVTSKLAVKYEAQQQKAWEALSALPEIKHFREVKGKDFNPLAVADVRYCVERLPEELTKHAKHYGGEFPNMDEDTLGKIRHPVAKLTLNYKKISKVLSTYVNPYRQHLFEDGMAHPQTKVASTRTWRTSAADFNYQNQPKHHEKRRDVRAQVSKLGYKVVSFDYAAIQARNIAMESLDPFLIKSFKERYDIHSDWVERIVRVHPGWIKEGAKKLAQDKALFKKYRNKVKQDFVFCSFFGAKSRTVAFYLGCQDNVAIKLHEDLWTMFPEVPRWHRRLERMYRKHGYVTGLSGFRRHGPLSHNELINAPIQSDESIIVLDAMTRLSEKGWEYQPNMEIHDDLTFIWPANKVDERIPEVINIMLTVPYEWANVVPIGVEVSVGDDWFKQSKYGEYFSDTWRK